ncbi:uncharacterized protein LOC126549798 [Aphis gossypii]|uniref:uncharacterized protein LOC126549798 n=1 Tax=Aphis gossypii TaxID=80765 RepID=UPI00215955CD|nr:uncharacterized protein LOC126549798 [Aphis gossypii]
MADHNYVSINECAKKYCKRYCCTPQCKNKQMSTSTITFHSFPKQKDLKLKWKTALKIGKEVPKYAFVCSTHFDDSDFIPSSKTSSPAKIRRLKIGVVPSKNLPVRLLDKVLLTPTKEKIIKRAERLKQRRQNKEHCQILFQNDCLPDSTPITDVEELSSSSTQTDVLTQEKTTVLSNEIKTADKEVQVNTFHSDSLFRRSIMDLIRNDEDLVALTGIPSMDKLLKLVNIGEFVIKSLNYNINFSLDILHRIVLVLMKLKLNTSYKCLAVLFGVCKSTCTNYFYETIDLLYLILKPLVLWPSKSSISKNIPKCFINFTSTRVVVDGTETPIEVPKCLSCRIRTYSFYKGKHTIKFMVGISPDGLITFVSDVYGGKASDKHIFVESNILEKCDIGDGVMADKGFLIEEECSRAGVKLFRPPFLKKNKQLSFEDT